MTGLSPKTERSGEYEGKPGLGDLLNVDSRFYARYFGVE